MIILGQFGVVYKATLRNSDGRLVEVAIKTIRRYDSQKEMDDFMREMTVMSQLIHPNIIHLYGIVKEGVLRNIGPLRSLCYVVNIND